MRSYTWYLIPKEIKHNKIKPLCIDLECELDASDCIDRIVGYIRCNKEAFNVYASYEINVLARNYYYKGSGVPEYIWCEKCSFFMDSPKDYYGKMNPLILEYYDQCHGYNNPYWQSPYFDCIKNLGSSTMLFQNSNFQYVISDDITNAKDKLKKIGSPKKINGQLLKPYDNYVYRDEVTHVLDILEKWTQNTDGAIFLEY